MTGVSDIEIRKVTSQGGSFGDFHKLMSYVRRFESAREV